MSFYKNIKCVSEKNVKAEKSQIISQKNLRFFSLFFICVVTMGIFGVSLSNLGISTEVKYITSSWSPNITDLGKLKFVTMETDEEVMMSVSAMAMPFENAFISEDEVGMFSVNGLGGIIVKCCLAGRVNKIEQNGETKTIYISHSKGLVSVYDNIDTVGVKENDRVEKNTPLGVSLSSKIGFKVLYKNKMLAGLTVKNGELTFM